MPSFMPMMYLEFSYPDDFVKYPSNIPGAWVPLSSNPDILKSSIDKLLQQTSAFSYLVTDTRDLHGYRVCCSDIPTRLSEIVRAFEANPQPQLRDALAHLLNEHFDVATARRMVEEAHQGIYDSLGEYAHRVWDERNYRVPPFILRHIDWESAGNEMEELGQIRTFRIGDHVHVFTCW